MVATRRRVYKRRGEKAGGGMKVASQRASLALSLRQLGRQAGYASNSISHFNFSHLWRPVPARERRGATRRAAREKLNTVAVIFNHYFNR